MVGQDPRDEAVTTGTGVVTAASGTVAGINFSLSIGGKISGRVTNVVGGAALANVNARISKADGSFLSPGPGATLSATSYSGGGTPASNDSVGGLTLS